MMYQSDLVRLMAMGGGQAHNGDEEEGVSVVTEKKRLTEEGNPFTFSPQLLRLQRDHELFEVITTLHGAPHDNKQEHWFPPL